MLSSEFLSFRLSADCFIDRSALSSSASRLFWSARDDWARPIEAVEQDSISTRQAVASLPRVTLPFCQIEVCFMSYLAPWDSRQVLSSSRKASCCLARSSS
ncbi:hypothetical protein ACVWZR_004716 [Bradyrhizobium sp. i1.3.1]